MTVLAVVWTIAALLTHRSTTRKHIHSPLTGATVS